MFPSLTKISDFSKEQIWEILKLAKELQDKKEKNGFLSPLLRGKNIAMIFEKPSLRTKAAFEIAAADLGAHPIFFGRNEIFLSDDGDERESLFDIIKNLEKFCDLIGARVFSHSTISQMAEFSGVPIINFLCDQHHPTQAICDIFAIWQHYGKVENLKIAWIGDGNNVANSLAQICEILGINFFISSPKNFQIPPQKISNFKNVFSVDDPLEAAQNANVIMTDTWVSMGEEKQKQEKIKQFSSFQINKKLMKKAKKKAIFMHCLPAHRNIEVSSEVFDSSQSIVFKQAVARLFIARALLIKLLK